MQAPGNILQDFFLILPLYFSRSAASAYSDHSIGTLGIFTLFLSAYIKKKVRTERPASKDPKACKDCQDPSECKEIRVWLERQEKTERLDIKDQWALVVMLERMAYQAFKDPQGRQDMMAAEDLRVSLVQEDSRWESLIVLPFIHKSLVLLN